MPRGSTGYEGQDEDEEGSVTFELELVAYMYTARGITCRLLRDGEASGIVYLKSKNEFEWLRERINGTFDPEIYQVNIKGESP